MLFSFRFAGNKLKSKRIPFIIIPLAVLLLSAWFLWPAPTEFPMDDTYIHFMYAENLVERGSLFFNSPDESGLGSTSLTWVLMLAAGSLFGLHVHLTAKVLGILSLAALGIGIHFLLLRVVNPVLALLTALLISLSGNMLWFALSGMETVLFLALATAAVLLYRERRWLLMGLVVGVMILTRPEGLLLPVSFVMFESLRARRISIEMLASLTFGALIALPWFGYLFLRTGYFLPTSALGKRLSFALASELILNRSVVLAELARIPGTIYTGSWLIYIVLFTLGGMAGPPPSIPIGSLVGEPDYSVSIWALIAQIVIVIPLLAKVWRPSYLNRLRRWILEPEIKPFVILLIWAVLHNLAYMIFIPVPGTAGRYGALNLILMWAALAMGLGFASRRNAWWKLRAGGLIFLAAINTTYWNSVYDANLDHMINVRIKAAHYVRDQLPVGEKCAAFDIGALRYHSRRTITDLGGLVDPEARRRYLAQEYDNYLVENDVTCLILPGSIGTEREGWFDFASGMGFTDSDLFDLEQIEVFEIGRERWLQGYLPTSNYMASVSIYRLGGHVPMD